MYGGTLTDEDGNPDCTSIVHKNGGSKGGKIPMDLYYSTEKDPFYPGEENLKQQTIGFGSKFELEFKFATAGRLRYWYKIEPRHQIHFAIYFVSISSEIEKKQIEKRQTIHPLLRLCTFNVPERLEIKIPEAGTVFVEFNNENSWFCSKNLHYFFEVKLD